MAVWSINKLSGSVNDGGLSMPTLSQTLLYPLAIERIHVVVN